MMGGLAYMTGRAGDPLRAGASVNDILGGHVDSMMDNAASQIPYVTSGKTTALFVTSDYRFDGYPQVSTAKELGITGLVPTGWFGCGGR
ncbi:hypothetical protein G6F58_013305 [Rhizopus delemar]|nr:hypothetical protein G6F58_013305 [Rhizopus delemar]